ncbi:MAG: 1-acyl-sn-glycerol-3-phosphate acyltransferase [Gammaproteobacteria bacterium]|nr:1-acyl-sn-glycerol-3-phosphate acyltransferase [Gammaproteobacteria bacterium]MBU1624835.1 1-acyl-sn-glycerol-3-phosphate acyltransferase [Gammaproteobacteria bacterium]MBU1982679.1 1-acyl-sn-glycerol-3-phosphate acyltransferase [Gammaproteobacteria bacterium]
MLRRTVALFRALRLALHIGYGLTMAVIYPRLSAGMRHRILQNWSADLLGIFNVKLEAVDLSALRNGLIVSNHISWLDIFVLNSVVPMRFVAKSEVRRWPAIGWLCARANTLFIERGNARAAARINKQLGALMQQGECFAVFPEGTSTDGAQVAHFHASLLQPAIDASVPLHPIAIRYEDDDGERSTAAAYIDDISFGASMWTLLNTPKLHVCLIPTPSLPAADFERRELAQRAHEAISVALQQAASHKLHIALTDAQHSETNLLPSIT